LWNSEILQNQVLVEVLAEQGRIFHWNEAEAFRGEKCLRALADIETQYLRPQAAR